MIYSSPLLESKLSTTFKRRKLRLSKGESQDFQKAKVRQWHREHRGINHKIDNKLHTILA
jgi:hypothetical protein